MTTTIVVALAGILLLFMFGAYTALGAPPSSEDDDDPVLPGPTLRDRVETVIRLLNYGDEGAAQEAMRQLLSMGSCVLPVLLDQLRRIEHHPGALSPRCQLLIEELLVDFGLQTYLQTADSLPGVHRASPVLPAITRVLARIGPHLLIELTRGTVQDPVGLAAPLMWRWGQDALGPLRELLLAKPAGVSDGLLRAILPVLARYPDALTDLLASLDTPGRDRLVKGIGHWPLPGLPDIVDEVMDSAQTSPMVVSIACRHPSQFRDAVLRRLVDSLNPVDPALAQTICAILDIGTPREEGDIHQVRASVEGALRTIDDPGGDRLGALKILAWHTSDPRAFERVVGLAGDSMDPLGGIALVRIAQLPGSPLEPCLMARLRSAELTLSEQCCLQYALATCADEVGGLLQRLLRTESPRVVPLVARLLTPHAPTTEGILKALGRHRYSPVESEIASLLWARWPQVEAEVVACVASTDREVALAAIEMLGSLGASQCTAPLLARPMADAEVLEPVMNAVELLGPDALPHLEEFIEAHPELSWMSTIERRRAMLAAQATMRNDG